MICSELFQSRQIIRERLSSVLATVSCVYNSSARIDCVVVRRVLKWREGSSKTVEMLVSF